MDEVEGIDKTGTFGHSEQLLLLGMKQPNCQAEQTLSVLATQDMAGLRAPVRRKKGYNGSYGLRSADDDAR